MTESTKSPPEARGPNLVERAKEEFEAILHPHKSSSNHHRETHGLNSDIDENTLLEDVKAPNVFERAKEEFQAIAQVFHHNNEKASTHDIRNGNQTAETNHKQEISSSSSETKAKEGNIFLKAKAEIKSVIHHFDKSKQHHHDKETHGMNDDINENTPIDEVKGPNVFERVKEEFEAVLQAIHPKKES
ncbi:uncharacterized protein LOC131640755 isoform X1 [Vicia villosa]|uniref:uncharacterized protein LOC131640755 isoform X1 n=1 Tax=Vicia villosa TaxID=3911 RepID=UPI00273BDCF7|nr:uncharacterized protein LOC131640755 isoform X1 [Vicia villosa]